MTASEWAQPLIFIQDQAARIVELQADLARVTAEREETQTQVGDWIVRTDEANVRAEAAEAKLAERDAEIARLRDAATAWQAFKDAHTVTDHWASVDRLDRALLNKEPTP